MPDATASKKSIWDNVDRVFAIVDILIYIIMICVVMVQIFARVCLPKVPPWTEEISRFFQIYLVAFGAGLAIKHDSFVAVESIFGILKPKHSIVVKIFDQAVAFAMFVLMAVSSIEFFKLGIPRSAVSLPWLSMSVIYFSMILLTFSSLFFILRKVYGLVQDFRKEGK